jgi:phosphonate transport system substrate-binding protein
LVDVPQHLDVYTSLDARSVDMVGKLVSVLGGFVMVIGLAGCGADADASDRPSVRLAVTEMKGLEQLQREFGAFETELEERADVELELFPVSDRSAAAAALVSEQVDLVFTGPAEYVVMAARTEVEPLVGIRRPGYSSCIWTTSDSGIDSLAALKGETVAMEDIGSTSAHLGPSQILADANIDPLSDLEIQFVGGAMQEALERGDVAAVGAGCHDYDEFRSEGDAADFKLLERGPQLPDDVILARTGLDEEIVEGFQAAFEEGWPALRTAMIEGEENEKFAEATLVPKPIDDDYDGVRSMYQTIGVDDFTKFVG